MTHLITRLVLSVGTPGFVHVRTSSVAAGARVRPGELGWPSAQVPGNKHAGFDSPELGSGS